MHPAALSEDELLKQCRVGRGRSGGPGGQHRNKVETHVTITHEPTGIAGQAGERRSQHENKKVALRRLRLALAVEVRAARGPDDAPSALWRSRLSPSGDAARIVCSAEHADYPALLAEALDAAAAHGWDVKGAAAGLCATPTSVIRLISAHAPAFVRLNGARAAAGHPALRAP